MESRLDRYKQRRKQNLLRIVKLIVIACMCMVFTFLVMRVNYTIIELNILDNTDIFGLDISNKSITLMGDTYRIYEKR